MLYLLIAIVLSVGLFALLMWLARLKGYLVKRGDPGHRDVYTMDDTTDGPYSQ